MIVRNAFAVLVSVAAVFGLGAGIASAAPVVQYAPETITVQDDLVDAGIAVSVYNSDQLAGFGIIAWTPEGVGAVGVINGLLNGGFGPR